MLKLCLDIFRRDDYIINVNFLGEALAVDVDSGEIQTMEGLEFYENSLDVLWRKNKNNLAISGW